MDAVKKFEAGKSYYSRCVCNYDCIFIIEVVKRTAKTVTYVYNRTKRRSNIKLDEHGNEWIKPDNYSMAPVFRAERPYEVHEPFYFTFGSWEGYPFQNGYIIVMAENIKAAAIKFNELYPNDQDKTVLNCSGYYDAEDWYRLMKQGYYKGRQPYKVIQ